jgi:CRP-like cAMP-binding protein
MDVLDLLAQSPASAVDPKPPYVGFADWQPEERAVLGRLGTVETFVAGTTVIAAGAPDRSLLIVLEGELEVVRRDRVVYRVVPGDLVGELAFVDGRPRSASVHAVGTAKALRVRPEDVERLAVREPALALKFVWEVARILAARLRGAWN